MLTPLALTLYLLQAPDQNNDWLGIIAVGFDFVLFSVILFAFFNWKIHAKAAKLWPKLAPVIKGTFHRGIGLTTPYLEGNYRGLPVRARMRLSARSRWDFDYYFDILATTDRGGRDWELRYNPGVGEADGWALKTKDPALEQRLLQSGLIALLPSWDHGAAVRYNGGKGTLLYSHRIYSRDGLPSPEAFAMQLDMLKRFAAINKRVNEAPVAGNLLNR
jgi:hypothetical protein